VTRPPVHVHEGSDRRFGLLRDHAKFGKPAPGVDESAHVVGLVRDSGQVVACESSGEVRPLYGPPKPAERVEQLQLIEMKGPRVR